jgi:hypothetical protein
VEAIAYISRHPGDFQIMPLKRQTPIFCNWWIEESSARVSPRRSSCVVKAPRRLIEEKVVYMSKINEKVYEMALVGAGIGRAFNHSSELNMMINNKTLGSHDMDEHIKWIWGMDEEHARFLLIEVWVAVLKRNYEEAIPK